jgi:hypothetical protein
VPRLLRLLVVAALVLGAAQLVTAPAATARRAGPVVLDVSARTVPYAGTLALAASAALAEPGARIDFYAQPAGGVATRLGGSAAGSDGSARLSVTVSRTASYVAVLVEGGVETARSEPVPVVVAPLLSLVARRVVGPVNHFTVTAKPAVDGIPVVLQQRVGGRWKKVEKGSTDAGQFTWTVGVPGDVASKWRVLVHASKRYGPAISRAITVIDP